MDKRLKSLPTLGSAHGTDQAVAYGPGDLTDYVVNFVNNLDPNGPTVLAWPQYNSSSAQLLVLQDGNVSLALEQDTFREDAIAFVIELVTDAL